LGQVGFNAGMVAPPDSNTLAEYDVDTDSIRTLPEMLFADSRVLAAYMAHEYVHANDRDNLTSLNEETRGYLASIAYWQRQKGELIEPNLDTAVRLYQQGLPALMKRIQSVYYSDAPA
jgi:hypothetical protein